jgi:hypothetical protein
VAPTGFRRTGGAPGRGGGGARPHAHLGSRGGQSWGREVAGVGARRGPAAAAAACGVAGEEGSRLANKRRLCLTCEPGEALGVSARDEKLRKKEARSSGGHGGGSGNGGACEGAALNRGGSVGSDDGVTLKMRPWYGRPRSARV